MLIKDCAKNCNCNIFFFTAKGSAERIGTQLCCVASFKLLAILKGLHVIHTKVQLTDNSPKRIAKVNFLAISAPRGCNDTIYNIKDIITVCFIFLFSAVSTQLNESFSIKISNQMLEFCFHKLKI